MRKQIRKLRHWKQRFNRNAEFVFRRKVTWGNRVYEPGDPIPKELQASPTKLRRFWESRTVELAEFEDPDVATGQKPAMATLDEMDLPEGVSVVSSKGSWFIVTTPLGDEMKVNGRKALNSLLEELRIEAKFEAEAEGMDDTLIGSSVLESTYEIEDETIPLGEIVMLAFQHSGLTVAEWNALENDICEDMLEQSLFWMCYQGEDDQAQPGDDDAPEPDASDELADDEPLDNTEAPDTDGWLDGSTDKNEETSAEEPDDTD